MHADPGLGEFLCGSAKHVGNVWTPDPLYLPALLCWGWTWWSLEVPSNTYVTVMSQPVRGKEWQAQKSQTIIFFSYLKHTSGYHGWIEDGMTKHTKKWLYSWPNSRAKPGMSTEMLARIIAAVQPPSWFFCSRSIATGRLKKTFLGREGRECKDLATLPGLNACTGQWDLCWEEMSVSKSLISVMRLILHWHVPTPSLPYLYFFFNLWFWGEKMEICIQFPWQFVYIPWDTHLPLSRLFNR